MAPAQPTTEPGFGRLLRQWRTQRGMSQLDLSVEAGVSARHLSFVETGRARASREMVLLLARVLDVPLRDRNDLLVAAGYAPLYRATALDAPAMAQVRRALDLMLRQQEPYPAIVLDRHWNILDANAATGRLVTALLDPQAVTELGGNAMRLMFHPHGFRPHIVNWEPGAAALIQWLHRDVLSGFADAETRRLLEELLAYPEVPARWRTLDLDVSTAPFLPVEFRKGDSRCATSPRSRASAPRTTSRSRSCASRRSFRPTRRPNTRHAASPGLIDQAEGRPGQGGDRQSTSTGSSRCDPCPRRDASGGQRSAGAPN